MNQQMLDDLAEGLADETRSFVSEALEPLVARIKTIETTAPLKGDPGEKGERGDPGEAGPAGDKGDAGEAGMPGADGKDGVDGKDGEPGPKGDAGEPGIKGEKGDPGMQGDAGMRGEKGDPGARGNDGEPGRDGRDGEKGLDGFNPEILLSVDFERSYPRGTFATFKGGLWRAGERTDGTRGWDCIIRGIDSFDLSPDDVDPRLSRLQLTLSDGVTKQLDLRNKSLAWCGTYKRGEEYVRGDVVVFGGSSWAANQVTREAPGTGAQDWTVLARKGNDGKDGKGERGEKGETGRAGRDLTQLGPNGEKW